MLKAKLKDKIPCREIRAKTYIKDVVKFAAKQKWKWAGHVARLNDNRMMDEKNHRLATKIWQKVTRKTGEEMARRHRADERNHLGQRCRTARRLET